MTKIANKMNWVGGSRNRLVMKNDAKKQREFFAKRKLQQKLQNLGVTPPAASSGDISTGSTDLLTLFVVNQIASKKTHREPPKVAVFGRSKRSRHRMVLPMSPCSPSRLSLVEGPVQSSCRENTEQNAPQRIKYGQSSPVLESAFSDKCASDFLPPINDPSMSISPSGHGFFPLVMQRQAQSQALPHYSPSLWDTSTLPQAEFQPFSQPRSMTDPVSWSVRSNPPPFQLGTPTSSQFLFGSPNPDKTERGVHGGHSGPFIVNQPEHPTLEFPRSHSEPLHVFEEEDFPMFNDNNQGTESAPFGNAGSSVYLRGGSSVRAPSPQTVPNPQAAGMELSNCSETNSSCLGENAGLSESFEYSPSCSCRAGYLSSDSNDDEPCCGSCHQDSAFYLDEARCSDGLKSASQRITVLSQQRPLSPLMRSKTNVRVTPNTMLNEPITDAASEGQQTGSFKPPSSSPRPLGEICGCKKMFTESEDVSTQTAYPSAADTRDASTQCSFVENTKTRDSGFPLLRPAVDASQQFPANERETETEPQALRAPSKGSGSKDGVALLSWKKPKNASGSMAFNNVAAEKRPIKPSHGFWSLRGEENGEKREETGRDENNPLVREVFDEGREEVTSPGRGHTLSEEAETLREIADVLLLLKQRMNDQE